MSKLIPALSRGMLIVGIFLILAGLGWGIWVRVNQPAEPVITEEGAVVLAVTAPVLPVTSTLTPTELPTATPTRPPSTAGPTPELLPDWTITPTPPEPAPTSLPATPIPPSPTPTPAPTATPAPPAENPPTRIVAPAIDLDARVVPMGWELVDRDGTMVSEWLVPEKAAGWHMNSALPGHQENMVLSGHHNIEGKVFRYVVDLEPGDEITVYADDTPYSYIVAEKYILKETGMPLYVRKKNAQWIMPSGDERLTLVTCWPYEWPGNSHRVIVVARPPSYFEEIGDGAKSKGAK
jgi:sortase A